MNRRQALAGLSATCMAVIPAIGVSQPYDFGFMDAPASQRGKVTSSNGVPVYTDATGWYTISLDLNTKVDTDDGYVVITYAPGDTDKAVRLILYTERTEGSAVSFQALQQNLRAYFLPENTPEFVGDMILTDVHMLTLPGAAGKLGIDMPVWLGVDREYPDFPKLNGVLPLPKGAFYIVGEARSHAAIEHTLTQRLRIAKGVLE